jgi:hypothetical protein
MVSGVVPLRDHPPADTGKIEGKLEIDQNKIKADAARARQKLGGTSPAAQGKPTGP